MRIKKYTAANMKEAMVKIKQDLGDDAVILKSRKLPKKMFAMGGQDAIEVTAAIDERTSKTQAFRPITLKSPPTYGRKPTPTPTPTTSSQRSSSSTTKANTTRTQPTPSGNTRAQTASGVTRPQAATSSPTAAPPEYTQLKKEIADLKSMLQKIAAGQSQSGTQPGYSGIWETLYQRLLKVEVHPTNAAKIIEHVRSKYAPSSKTLDNERLAHAFAETLPVTGAIDTQRNRGVRVAFVGPTGTGKTTTIAKLASYLVINRGKQVSIITADTYRVAAIEQIRAFSEIIGARLSVVFSPEEIDDALAQESDADVVFIDTAGRSQNNPDHMEELSSFLHALTPDETHLVLSATMKDSDLTQVVKRYAALNVNRLLFTKLDETVCVGNVFNTVFHTSIPMSYFTTGQSVPDDIEVANSSRLVTRLFEGSFV